MPICFDPVILLLEVYLKEINRLGAKMYAEGRLSSCRRVKMGKRFKFPAIANWLISYSNPMLPLEITVQIFLYLSMSLVS